MSNKEKSSAEKKEVQKYVKEICNTLEHIENWDVLRSILILLPKQSENRMTKILLESAEKDNKEYGRLANN